MAFVILYSIQDEKGSTSTTEVNIPGVTAFTDAVLFAQEMGKLINDLITGAITRIGIAFIVDLPAGLRAAPTALSDVEEGARFQFATANNFYTGLRLPTFAEGNIVAGTQTVDEVDADVTAFVTAMVSGIDLTGVGGSGTIQPCDKREEDVTRLETAREQFLSSRGRKS